MARVKMNRLHIPLFVNDSTDQSVISDFRALSLSQRYYTYRVVNSYRHYGGSICGHAVQEHWIVWPWTQRLCALQNRYPYTKQHDVTCQKTWVFKFWFVNSWDVLQQIHSSAPLSSPWPFPCQSRPSSYVTTGIYFTLFTKWLPSRMVETIVPYFAGAPATITIALFKSVFLNYSSNASHLSWMLCIYQSLYLGLHNLVAHTYNCYI